MSRPTRNSSPIHAQIPVSILVSEAFRTLRPRYQMVLVALAGTYRGRNNGDLKFTRKDARQFGINSETTRSKGLRLLHERGLIEKTYQGGIASGSKFPTLWALTWRPIDYAGRQKLDVVRLPSDRWKDWDENKSIAPQGVAVTAPQGGAVKAIYGTTGSSSRPPFTAPACGAPSKNLPQGAKEQHG